MELMQHAWYLRRDHWLDNLAESIRLPVPCSNVEQEPLPLLVNSRTYVKVLPHHPPQYLHFRQGVAVVVQAIGPAICLLPSVI